MSIAAEDRTAAPALPPSMVERMTLIMDEFAGPSVRLTLEDISRRTHLPRSTAHRILDQLLRLDWLDHSSVGYSLGSRSLGLGGRDNGHCELRAVVAPQLQELFVRTGLTAHLAVLDGAEVYILDKLGGREASLVPTRVGGRAAAARTAVGTAILAWLTPEDVDDLLDATPRGVEGGAIEPVRFHAELNKVRMRRGLAFQVGGAEGELACAAAVRGPEGPIGAISLVAPGGVAIERLGPLVLDAAMQISQELFPGLTRTRVRSLQPVD
jgi:DNA-binding IclR family transcriptional regulator